MKRYFSSIRHVLVMAAVACILLGTTAASAQSKASIYIPFAFTANHQTFAAGHYTLELLSDRFLCFTNTNTGRHQAVIMVQPEQADYIETRGRLRFLVHRDHRHLMEVRFAGSSLHSAPVVQRSLARELATTQELHPTVDIAMK